MTKTKKALTEFEGYAISRTKNNVEFGCGDVTISKKDLLLAAEIAGSAEFKKAMKLFNKIVKQSNGYYYFDELVAITPATFRALVGE